MTNLLELEMDEIQIFYQFCEVNNYIVRSYRYVIVVTNTATRRTNKA